MRDDYKFTHRKNRNIQVCFRIAPSKWISTGTEDMKKAIIFAEKYMNNPKTLLSKINDNKEEKMIITLSYVAEEFCKDNCKCERDWNLRHNLIFKDKTYTFLKKMIYDYILPFHGDMDITQIKKRDIENMYLNSDFTFVNDKKYTGDQTRNKILLAYKKLLNYAERKAYIDFNPAIQIKSINLKKKSRGAFSKAELALLFPQDNQELLKIWRSYRNVCYFLIMRDTGFRPSEILGLRFSNFKENYKSLYTTGSADPDTHRYQETIKTSFTGQDYKIGILTKQTQNFIIEYKSKCRLQESSFLFNQKGSYGKLMNANNFNSILSRVLKKLGIEKDGRCQYSLRHSFNTDLYNSVNDTIRFELMGHTKNRPEYDNRTIETRLNFIEKQGIRDLLEKRNQENITR